MPYLLAEITNLAAKALRLVYPNFLLGPNYEKWVVFQWKQLSRVSEANFIRRATFSIWFKFIIGWDYPIYTHKTVFHLACSATSIRHEEHYNVDKFIIEQDKMKGFGFQNILPCPCRAKLNERLLYLLYTADYAAI